MNGCNDFFSVRGGNRLIGDIHIAGAKNAALPLMCAALLTDEICALHDMPHLTDISTCAQLLSHLGATINVKAAASGNGQYRDIIEIKADCPGKIVAPYEIVSKMRASFLVLGPLLTRFGYAKVSLPGGCAIGQRPVNLHLDGLKALGANINVEEGYVIASAPSGRLHGAKITLPFASVGATEHLLLAAALADGETVIENAAREPEIVNLADMLRAMGAEISGDGTPNIRIQGKTTLSGCDITVIPDRIETGSFLIAALMTDGDISLPNADPASCDVITATLQAMGADITAPAEGGLRARGNVQDLRPMSLVTAPHPGFPTDMQAQCMALLSLVDGVSCITENVFENRFMHVPEMVRMGANVTLDADHKATIHGVRGISGTELQATDLRASISLVLMALAAEGESRIYHLHHIDRGYESVEEKLRSVGADITRLKKQQAA